MTTLATDQKLPLSHFHISYQNQVTKNGHNLVKKALKSLKNKILKKKKKKFNLVAHFLLLTFFENFNF